MAHHLPKMILGQEIWAQLWVIPAPSNRCPWKTFTKTIIINIYNAASCITNMLLSDALRVYFLSLYKLMPQSDETGWPRWWLCRQRRHQNNTFGKITVCSFALLPFCQFAFLPSCPPALLPSYPCPCPRHGSLFHLSFGSYQEKTFFVFVFTFRFMCRYRRLSWCYSCLHRWQQRPSSLVLSETNYVYALFGCNYWSSI